ncbi:DUF3618 domain-containing protein [Streptomyces oceani]|uniref:DUF3618 domain-containing protein n=1 Tax=Streptomyces oceani TaxID=1075402 RepID=A0A1E7JYI2_9ACTN|nr:DUF3618 domain-containing protein [Streptomyces oceani]OEU96737.1 hypothetical protein AN216_19120 [Streptomyces oceani]
MTQAQRGNGQSPTPQQLRAEVKQARGQLADTVSELAHKADMKTLARSKASELKSRATNGHHRSAEGAPGDGTAPETFASEKSARDQRAAQLAKVGAAVAGALAAGGVVVMLLRRRRSGDTARSSAGRHRHAAHRHAHRPHASRTQRCGQAGE